jgi:hypothetical protein
LGFVLDLPPAFRDPAAALVRQAQPRGAVRTPRRPSRRRLRPRGAGGGSPLIIGRSALLRSERLCRCLGMLTSGADARAGPARAGYPAPDPAHLSRADGLLFDLQPTPAARARCASGSVGRAPGAATAHSGGAPEAATYLWLPLSIVVTVVITIKVRHR